MIVIGLTGSIAMGKSETAAMFRKLGIPVFDADQEVHRLYARDGAAVPPIAGAFPGTAGNGSVDRQALAEVIGGHPEKLRLLESIVHPLVRDASRRFLDEQRKAGVALAVLDIPLLFETGREKEVDAIVVVSAPAEIQRERALSRPGMTEEKLAAILARQLPDSEKRKRAHFHVDSAQGIDYAFEQVKQIVATLLAKSRAGAKHA